MKVKMHTQIIAAIGLGIVTGVWLGERTEYIRFVGDLFIRLLRMIMIPLIMASIVSGITSIGNIKSLGRMGIRTIVYYMTTTLLAVLVGLIIVNAFGPGLGADLDAIQTTSRETAPEQTPVEVTDESVLDSIVPSNIVSAIAEGQVLPVIFFSILLGIAITTVGAKAYPLKTFFESVNTVMLKITGWIMYLAPFGVFALMAVTVGKLGIAKMAPLAYYVVVAVVAMLIHAAGTLPILLKTVGGYSPVWFFRDMFSAIATAFSTASSAATMPVTIECLEENAGVDNKYTSFVIPLGATMNMDGTAIYVAVSAVFIAQAFGYPLSLGQHLVIMLTASLASIGAAAIPSAGFMTLVIVLRSVNLPLEGAALVVAVQHILDMCRTSVNVWGDACGAAIIASLEEKKRA